MRTDSALATKVIPLQNASPRQSTITGPQREEQNGRRDTYGRDGRGCEDEEA